MLDLGDKEPTRGVTNDQTRENARGVTTGAPKRGVLAERMRGVLDGGVLMEKTRGVAVAMGVALSVAGHVLLGVVAIGGGKSLSRRSRPGSPGFFKLQR